MGRSGTPSPPSCPSTAPRAPPPLRAPPPPAGSSPLSSLGTPAGSAPLVGNPCSSLFPPPLPTESLRWGRERGPAAVKDRAAPRGLSTPEGCQALVVTGLMPQWEGTPHPTVAQQGREQLLKAVPACSRVPPAPRQVHTQACRVPDPHSLLCIREKRGGRPSSGARAHPGGWPFFRSLQSHPALDLGDFTQKVATASVLRLGSNPKHCPALQDSRLLRGQTWRRGRGAESRVGGKGKEGSPYLPVPVLGGPPAPSAPRALVSRWGLD